MTIRKIRSEDDKAIHEIIVLCMTEFNADPKTTVLADESIKNMSKHYTQPGKVYFVAEENGKILGGAGISKLDGSEEPICELQRMFLLSEARGKGIGNALIEKCIESAKASGYDKMYLESLSAMTSARKLYLSKGFKEIPSPLGNTGHGGCNVFMIRELNQ